MTRRSIEAGKAVIVIDVLDKANASFNKLTSKMMASARGLRNLGQQAAGAGLLTGLVSRGVINNFVEFEDKILNLTAKLGIFGVETNQQKANIKDLTKTIIDLGRVTSYTSAEVADAAISLAQAGFSITEIKSSLKAVLDLARGTGYALGDTADLLANTVRTFNLLKPGNSAAVLAENMATINHVASMMVKATRLGTIEIQDLRESMKYAGGTSVNLGANLSTVLGLLVQMSESGLKASLAGTSMNTAFLNLANNLEQLQGRLPKFQLFMSTLQDGTKGVDFGQTLKSLMDATKGMDRMEKTKLFGDIFNIRGARMVSSVQEMERVEFFIKEIAAAGEEGALASAKMESGLGGAIRRLVGNLDSLNIAMGYTFRDGAIAIANFATIGVAALERLTASHKILVGALVFSPVIFIGIAGSAMILSVALARLRTMLIGLATAFNALKRFGGFLGGSLMSLGNPLAALKASRIAKAAQYKALQMKVAKQGAAIEAKLQKASASKNSAAATQKIFSTKAYQSFLSNTMKLRGMKGAGINPLDVMDKTLSRFLATSKNSQAIIKGLIATLSTVFKMPIGSMREFGLRLNNIKNGFKALMVSGKALPGMLKRIMLTMSAKIPTKSRSLEGLKGLFGAANQVRGGLSTGHVPNILDTRKLRSSLSLLKAGSLAKSASGLVSLSMGFVRLTATMGRFVFSWNFVGLALNALLMFGHKIPFIANTFKTIGDAFTNAFRQIGRIATYAAPALDLFSLAFKAFVKGDTALGVTAVSAGFQGLVAIIQNQLSAAWNAFAAKVAGIWVTFKQIGTVIWATIDALMQGLISIGTTLAGPLMQGLTDMFSGKSNFAEGFSKVMLNIALTLNSFVTNFSIVVVRFITQGFEFVNRFQKALGEAISYIPGTGNAGAAIVEQAEVNSYMDQFKENLSVGKLKGESMKRERVIKKAFTEVAATLAAQRTSKAQDLNKNSQMISNDMANMAATLNRQLQARQMIRDSETARLAALQNRDKSAPGVPNPAVAMKTFEYKLSALVGSIQAVSGNKLLKESPKEIELAQETNAKLDKLINVVQTQGM
jgi:TP901 family phage tail tape measure protein